MRKIFTFFFFLLIILRQSELIAADINCFNKVTSHTDTDLKKDFKNFFNETQNWTEVKNEESLEMTDHPPVVRLIINFTSPLKTRITEDHKNKRVITKICKNNDGYIIYSRGIKLNIIKTQKGIRSQFRIPIIGSIETYYYMPTEKVEPIIIVKSN
jgi:hypothetical protein